MIAVRDITATAGAKTLLEGINAEFLPGKMNLIVGPNGAGKSSLIKILCKQLKPQTGSVSFDGVDAAGISLESFAKFRAVLSQNIDMAFPLTVEEVVMMGRYPHFVGKPGPHDIQAVKEAMALFDVIDFRDRNYLTLSGGERQRVHFARVMSQIWYPEEGKSRYLLLDEPLTFLDVHYQFAFMHQLRQLLSQSSLVIVGVVHDLNLASRFADHILLLHQGKVLSAGAPSSVLTTEHVKQAFQLEPLIYENAKSGGRYLFFE